MKLSSPLSILILGTLSLDLPTTVTANFHVGSVQSGGLPRFGACPSNYYKCDCFHLDNRKGHIFLPGGRTLIDNYFQIQAGFCGMPKLDFYKRSDGHWDFYKNNGDGTLEGTCYSNRDSVDCLAGRISWEDDLVCYSYVCGN